MVWASCRSPCRHIGVYLVRQTPRMMTLSSPLHHPPDAAPLMLVACVRGLAWQAAQSPPLQVVRSPGDMFPLTEHSATPFLAAAPLTPKRSGLTSGSPPSRQWLERGFAEPVHCMTPVRARAIFCLMGRSCWISVELGAKRGQPCGHALQGPPNPLRAGWQWWWGTL